MNHAIRITLSYDDCKHVISKWSDRSQKVIVYQHDADEEISKTHVHLALYGCEVKAEALKRMWPDAPGKGNEFWSFKNADESIKYLAYMSKGHLREKYVKNFSQEEVERSRQTWVDPVKDDKTGDPSVHKIMKIMSVIESRHSYTVSRLKIDDDDKEIEYGTLFQVVRTETFKYLWGEKRIVPHASHYKIIAGSVYMRLCEKYGDLETGQKILQSLWY